MNRIAEARREKGLSQSALAKRAGMTAATLSRLESGKMRLTADYMRQIAEALDLRPEDLFVTAALAAARPDIEPYASNDPNLSKIAKRNLEFYRVITDCLELAGFPQNSVVMMKTAMYRALIKYSASPLIDV
jgi:transcriptional regulator with XRE-family HTH domain